MTSELVLEWKIYGKKLVQVQGLFPSKPQSDYNIHEPCAVNPATTNYPTKCRVKNTRALAGVACV